MAVTRGFDPLSLGSIPSTPSNIMAVWWNVDTLLFDSSAFYRFVGSSPTTASNFYAHVVFWEHARLSSENKDGSIPFVGAKTLNLAVVKLDIIKVYETLVSGSSPDSGTKIGYENVYVFRINIS